MKRFSNKISLHPKHGLAWTDGKAVFLTPVIKNIEKGADTDKHIKLGEFDHVEGLYWSHDLGSSCFLCVVEQKTVSLWWVEGSLPNLVFKQTRKINAIALPQGVLWNPYSDVLCILTKKQCSFYYQHLITRESFAFPSVDSGKITCGTWSRDGQRLFIGLGSIVMVYSWENLDNSITDYSVTAWRVPELDGQICAMKSLNDTWVMCSAELPLEALCKQKADMFEVPSITASKETDIHNNNMTESSDVLTPKLEASPSMTESLLNLQRTEQGQIRDYSQLIVFTVESSAEHPSIVCRTNIQGILVPDILYFHRDSFHAIVGSNNQSKVHVYNVGEVFKEVTKIEELDVPSDELVKGISSHYIKSAAFIILLTGTVVTPSDPAFISPSLQKDYDLQLRIFPFPGSVGQAVPRSGSIDSIAARRMNLPNLRTDASKAKQDKKLKHKDKSLKRNDAQGRFLGLFQKSPKGPKIIDLSKNQVEDQDLEVETVKFDDVSAKFSETIKFSYENLTEEEFKSAVKTLPDSSSEENITILKGDNGQTGSPGLDGDGNDRQVMAKHDGLGRITSESRKSSGSLPLLPIVTVADELTGHAVLRSTTSGMSSPRTPRIRLGINSLRSGSRSQSVPSMLDSDIEIPAPDIISTGDGKGPELSPDVFLPNNSEPDDEPDGGMMAKMSPDYCRLENHGHHGSEHHHHGHHGHHSNKHHHGNPSHDEWEDIERQVKEQGALLSDLHSKIESVLKCAADTSCVPLSGYQALEEPELVKFNYMYHDGDESCEKTFLLDRRRVKLDIVLQAFGLTSLEIAMGATAVLVGANVDGYIPIRFTPGSTVQISGQKKVDLKPDTNC
ncbi:uncharacterized protein LOC135488182 isoform X2 [Lineus longissimus]|uniref:uncharacterized protein LOC135488182 isoform X2 n=1 Tax=Lineus longissimus TaxID=88925 RepID=UPI00315DF230